MMRSKVATFCLLGLVALGAANSQAAESTLQVSEPIVRAMPAVAPASAAFFTLHNGSDRTRTLVAAHSSAAKKVELHTHTRKGDVMMMRPVPQIEIPAGETVVFQPGGLHVMLIGLNKALVDGEQVDLALEFADGERIELSVPVGTPPMPQQGEHHHGHHMH
jgi:copper(I)-binding protein